MPNVAGEDTNGCINVLTKLLPTALAKGNSHRINLVQVEKAQSLRRDGRFPGRPYLRPKERTDS